MNNYTISGRIIDSQTKEGIENVNIFIEKLGAGSSSSSDGYFNIEIESIVSPITLLINHIGFTPKKICTTLMNDIITSSFTSNTLLFSNFSM